MDFVAENCALSLGPVHTMQLWLYIGKKDTTNIAETLSCVKIVHKIDSRGQIKEKKSPFLTIPRFWLDSGQFFPVLIKEPNFDPQKIKNDVF